MAAKTNDYQNIGQDVGFIVDDNELILRIPLDRSAAKPSASGKMKLLGQTGGWQVVPGTDIKLNVMAGFKA